MLVDNNPRLSILAKRIFCWISGLEYSSKRKIDQKKVAELKRAKYKAPGAGRRLKTVTVNKADITTPNRNTAEIGLNTNSNVIMP